MGTYRPVLATEATNDTITRLLAHRSVRRYGTAPVTAEVVEALAAAAQSAATSSSQHAWSVIEVRDPARKAELASLTGSNPFINDAPVFLVFVVDLSRQARLAKQRGAGMEALQYQEALLVGTVDAALAAQNTVVAAESLGLGTCYVGGIRTHLEEVSELLRLPDYTFPLVGLALGWPESTDTAGVKPRPPKNSVWFQEAYAEADADAGLAQLEEDTREYYESQGVPGYSWARRALSRWRDRDSIQGRADNSAKIAAKGFTAR